MKKAYLMVLVAVFLIRPHVAIAASVKLAPGDIWDSLNIYIPKDENILKVIGNPHPVKLNPNEIRMVVWNMYKGKNASWKRDYELLAAGADILLLQEMFLDQKMESTFTSDKEHQYITAASFIYRSGNIRTGVVSASRVTPSRILYQQSKVREPVVNTPKMALFTYYPVVGHGKKLLTINIHAINFVNSFGLKRQIQEIEKIMEAHDGPLVFAGDFNTWSPGKLLYIKRMLKRNNLKSVEFSNDTRMRTFGNIIDYVFYRGLTLKREKVWGELEGADHKAMDVTFSID